MDISVRASRSYVNEDLSWIGKTEALKDADSITLDKSLFDLADYGDDNVIPSGVCIAKVTAGGKYGPYDDALANGQEVAAGFLVSSIPVDPNSAAGADLPGALMWHGEVDESELPTGHGLDAAGKVDLAAKFRFV